MPEAWIIDGVRTPRGRGKPSGALHGVHPQELFAQCLNAPVERTGIDPRATGAMLVQTVLDELERRDLTTGLVVMCTGGGMATATILERV